MYHNISLIILSLLLPCSLILSIFFYPLIFFTSRPQPLPYPLSLHLPPSLSTYLPPFTLLSVSLSLPSSLSPLFLSLPLPLSLHPLFCLSLPSPLSFSPLSFSSSPPPSPLLSLSLSALVCGDDRLFL